MRHYGVQAFDLCAETEKNKGSGKPVANVVEGRKVRTSETKKGGKRESPQKSSRRHP